MRGDEYIESYRQLVSLAPNTTLHVKRILAETPRASLFVGEWTGTREGGRFEIPFVDVVSRASDGRMGRIDIYDLDQLDAAREQYDELANARPSLPRGATSAITFRARDALIPARRAAR